MTEHYVVLGVARPRAEWFRDVGHWATSASLPAEFVRCLSLDEVRARLRSGRRFSAVLLDGDLPGVDRDLFDEARTAGAAPVVVEEGPVRRPWAELGAAAVVTVPLDRDALLATLDEHAAPARDLPHSPTVLVEAEAPAASGRLVAVTGPAASGSSTVAAALAQGLATDPSTSGRVLLLDAALDAVQGLLHDTDDVVPGLQELVEAHRAGRPGADEVRALTWDTGVRGYDLLLGLRRHRDWTALRPRAVEAATASLRGAWPVVVADVDGDLEGEPETGSLDVEERNLLARHLTATADVVVVTGTPTLVGVHRSVRLLADLLLHGVDAERLVPTVVGAPRSRARRAEIARAVGRLLGELVPGAAVASPLPLPHRPDVESAHRDGGPLPRALVDPLAVAVAVALERLPSPEPSDAPVPVQPGSLGTGEASWR